MVVELEVFNELVQLYESDILSGGDMDKDDVFDKDDLFDEDYGKAPIFELTAEDRDTFTTAYAEMVLVFKQSIADRQNLLTEKQSLIDINAPSETVDELSQAFFENEENIESLINELISYRDVLGYDAEREQQAFGANPALFADNSPPSFERISAFVFDGLEKPKESIDINAQRESAYPVNDSVVQVSYFESIALTMFDALDSTEDYSDDLVGESPSPAIAISIDNLEEQRDLQLARDCREILQAQGQDLGKAVVFERPDGNGIYRFSLEKESDTMTLEAKDRSVNPILVESQGKIINSQVTSKDAAQIGKAVSMLNEQSKFAEITR